jgi:tetratricopeptide (TPR) repeat protein
MLKPKKKISKRELKQDSLLTTYVQVTSFYDKYKKQISIGVTAFVVVVIALVIFFKNRADSNEQALTQLAAVHQVYDAGQYQQAIDGVPAQNVRGLKEIVDNHGGTKGGNLAAFYLADSYFQLGKFAEALETFESCGVSEALVESSRLAGIAACHEALGKFADAARYFEKAAGEDVTEGTAAEHLNNAAHNFALAGDKERAVDILKRIKKNYPTTTYGREADRFIAQLSL